MDGIHKAKSSWNRVVVSYTKWREKIQKTAKALKRQGVKAGVPDLCLPVPKGGYHGLFIELKKKYEGTARESQEKWLLKLYKQGYATHLCHGWEEAAAVIEKYLNLEDVKMKQEKVLTPEEVEKRLTKEKKKTIALKCIDCGRITEEIAKTSDGKLCRKCNSRIVPIGFLKEN